MDVIFHTAFLKLVFEDLFKGPFMYRLQIRLLSFKAKTRTHIFKMIIGAAYMTFSIIH